MSESLNADFTQRAAMDTASMDWQASPSPTVWRKRLDLVDGEFSRVTSVVRYDPDSSFHPHDHPQGEEILVLDGMFSDEHGDYPAGTYLLNPMGFRHAPFSRDGCVLFVKLCQYGGEGRGHVVVDTKTAPWTPGEAPGVEVMPLYADDAYPETMELLRLAAGAAPPEHGCPGGEEIFVLDGALEADTGRCAAGAWLRLPPDGRLALTSEGSCTLYRKRGHLAAATAP